MLKKNHNSAEMTKKNKDGQDIFCDDKGKFKIYRTFLMMQNFVTAHESQTKMLSEELQKFKDST